jgi:hypothetical protein
MGEPATVRMSHWRRYGAGSRADRSLLRSGPARPAGTDRPVAQPGSSATGVATCCGSAACGPLFISKHSRLRVMPIRGPIRVETIFADAVCAALRAGGVASDDIADERSRMSTIAFGKTRSPSVLGTLNDFAFMAQYGNGHGQEPERPDELMRFLARTPILPLAGANPIELTRAAFSSRSSH